MPNNTVKNEMIQMIQSHGDMQIKLLDGLKRDYENDIFRSIKDTNPEEYEKSQNELLLQIKELEEKMVRDKQRDYNMVDFLKRDDVAVTITPKK